MGSLKSYFFVSTSRYLSPRVDYQPIVRSLHKYANDPRVKFVIRSNNKKGLSTIYNEMINYPMHGSDSDYIIGASKLDIMKEDR